MNRTSSLAGVVMVLGMALAGCTEGDAQPKTGLGIDESTGAIVGVVLDESELPVAGVLVTLLNGTDNSTVEETTSIADGSFSFARIAPGPYVIKTFRLGYEDAFKAIEVVAGQAVDDVLLRLVQGRSDSPFHITDYLRFMVGGGMVKSTPDCMFIDLTPYGSPVGPGVTKTCQGANACLESLGCTDGASGCLGNYSPEGGYREFLENNTNWETILAEVSWRPTSAISGRGVLHETLGPNVTGASRCGSLNQQDPRNFVVVSDQPPIRTLVNDEVMADRGISPDDRCCDWRQRLFPAWCDLGNCDRFGPDVNVAGILIPTPVEIYFSIFIKEPMEDGWTAVPDAS